MAVQPFVGRWPLLQFRHLFFAQTVGLLGGVINPSQGRYLHTGQHKHRLNAHTNPSVPASEDNSCPRPRAHRNRHLTVAEQIKSEVRG
jgi:hypothetical protein